MATQTSGTRIERDAALMTAARMGLVAALALSVCTVVAFAVAIATPPRSGPWCTGACIPYPYTDAARFFPRDYVWMVLATPLLPLFLVTAACAHFCARPAARPLSLLGVCFSAMAAAVIVLDYFVQLVVIQPSLLNHETDGIALLTQYNAHGLFIALEDLGYLLLGAAFCFVGAAMPREIKPGSGIRWTLLAAGAVMFGSFIEMAWRFGREMAVPVELTLITIAWLTLIVAGVLLVVFFRRVGRSVAA